MKHMKNFLVMLAFLGLSLSVVYAENAYTISLITGRGYRVFYDGGDFGATGTTLQDAIDFIKGDAAGADCTIQFGNDGSELNMGSLQRIIFDNSGGKSWGKITLTGNATSALSDSWIIGIEDVSISIDCKANLTATGNESMMIFNMAGTLTVSDGTVQATGEDSHAIVNEIGTLTVSGGTVQATGDSRGAIANAMATANISGGTVQATGNGIFAIGNIYGGTLNISGGTVQATSALSLVILNGGGTVNISDGIVTGSLNAIVNEGGAVNIGGGAVSATTEAIASNEGTVNVSGGTVSSTNYPAITGVHSKISIAGSALITSANASSLHGTILLADTEDDPDWRLRITGGTVENTSLFGDAVASGSPGAIIVSGGKVLAKNGFAINSIGPGMITVSGGIGFTYGTTATDVVNGIFNMPPTGNAILVAWNNNGTTNYMAGTTTNIYKLPETATVVWAKQGSDNGISVANGENTGFIPVEGVTVGSAAAVTHTVTAIAGANGSITPNGAVTVTEGEDQTFIFTPESGYETDLLLIDNVHDPVAAAAGSYTFADVTADHTITVTFKIATGNTDIGAGKITVYPNPVNDLLYFDRETSFELIDIQGKVVIKSEKAVKSVNVSRLPAGVYFVKINAGTGYTVHKVIKK